MIYLCKVDLWCIDCIAILHLTWVSGQLLWRKWACVFQGRKADFFRAKSSLGVPRVFISLNMQEPRLPNSQERPTRTDARYLEEASWCCRTSWPSRGYLFVITFVFFYTSRGTSVVGEPYVGADPTLSFETPVFFERSSHRNALCKKIVSCVN